MKVEITLKCSTPKEARLLADVVDDRVCSLTDGRKLSESEQEELDMAEDMLEAIKWQYRVDILNEFEKAYEDERYDPKFIEYAQEAEHQDGYGYWLGFDNAEQVHDDFQLYLENSD